MALNLELPSRLGAAGVYLFGMGAFLAPAAANLGFGLLILALVLDWPRAWPVLRRDPCVWLLAAFALYLAFSLVWIWPPQGRGPDLDASARFLKLWLFLPLAYWLGGDLRRIDRFLLCVLAGFLVGRIAAIDWSTPPALLTGERLRLGFSSINHFGQYAATLFLGLLAYAGTIWQAAARRGQRLAWSLRAGWAVTAIGALYWTLASQSRGAVAALLLSLLFAALLAGYFLGRRSTLILLALVGGGALLAGLVAGEKVVQRLSAESATLAMMLNGDWSSAPYDNIGIRLHMVRLGWGWWLERPWFGHGAGAVAQMLAGSVKELSLFKHLHNTLIDLLVRLGLIGALLLQAIFVVVPIALWRRLRAGDVPLPLGAFALGTLVLSFLFGQIDFRMLAWDGRHYWVFVAAIAYAMPLAQRDAAPARIGRSRAAGGET